MKGLARSLACGEGGVEIGDHQVAANGVGVDGTVQVASAVEVVGEAEGESVAEIVLDAEVRLLRVGVDEILRLRISEGLEGERQERGLARVRGVEVQIILIEKDGLGKIQRSETAAGWAGIPCCCSPSGKGEGVQAGCASVP